MALRTLKTGPAKTLVEQVRAECARRLAAGFDYDFGDDRGVHRIGTTESDLKGWAEVTDIATAAISLGNSSAQITISTGTGVTSVTALEWQAILIAAGQFRQPLWAASFALQAMSPIPSDFAADSYWS